MNTIYKDKLIEVTDQEIVFYRYYFPFGGEKKVPLSHIKSVKVSQPSFFGGSWRIWGTGDFLTWFPLDGGRPGRDQIFLVTLRDSSRRIGFTVEDSQTVTGILRGRQLLHDTPST